MQGGETRSNTYRYATSSCYEGSQMATGSHRPDFTSSPCWQLKKLASRDVQVGCLELDPECMSACA